MTEEIRFNTCRKCAENFEYTRRDGRKVNFIAGSPLGRQQYRAISYVWEDTVDHMYRCNNCGYGSSFPVRDRDKFEKLAYLSVDEVGIWLDALSIDQQSAQDVKSQIGVMGRIFEGAECVMILMPASDGLSYSSLLKIGEFANHIYEHRDILHQPPPTPEQKQTDSLTEKLSKLKSKLKQIGKTTDKDIKTTTEPDVKLPMPKELRNGATLPTPTNLEEFDQLCQAFFLVFETFRNSLSTSTYWQRAWTFQEWVLARNLCVAIDSESETQWLWMSKQRVLFVITYLAVYRRIHGQYAKCKVGLENQQAVLASMSHARRLFPDERAFMPFDEMNEEELEFSFSSPSIEPAFGLGLRSVQRRKDMNADGHKNAENWFNLDPSMPPFSDVKRSMGRLSITLNALSETQRQARHEADLVACWASMCNIEYDYNMNDSFAAALQKVLDVLRLERKLKIYCFHVNSNTCDASVDTTFLDYACTHVQANTSLKSQLIGTPIFTGRADAETHFRNSLLPPSWSNVGRDDAGLLIPIHDDDVHMWFVRNFHDFDDVLRCLQLATIGQYDNFSFTDISRNFKDVMQTTRPEDICQHTFVLIWLPASESETDQSFYEGSAFWAVVPATTVLENLMVAREGLNGTLVLVDPEHVTHIVAYLNITDQQSGTHLVQIDQDGWIRMRFKTTQTPGLVNSELMRDRTLVRRLRLHEAPVPDPDEGGRRPPFIFAEENRAGIKQHMDRAEAELATFTEK